LFEELNNRPLIGKGSNSGILLGLLFIFSFISIFINIGIFFLLILSQAVIIFLDATKIRVDNNNQGPHPVVFGLLTIILWIIIVPFYIYYRRKFETIEYKPIDIKKVPHRDIEPKESSKKIKAEKKSLESPFVDQDKQFIEICSNSSSVNKLMKIAIEKFNNNQINEARDYAQQVINKSIKYYKSASPLAVSKYPPEKKMFLDAMKLFIVFGKAMKSAIESIDKDDNASAEEYVTKAGTAGTDAYNILLKMVGSIKQKRSTIPQENEISQKTDTINPDTETKRTTISQFIQTTPASSGQIHSTPKLLNLTSSPVDVRPISEAPTISKKISGETIPLEPENITWVGDSQEIRIYNYLIPNPLIYLSTNHIENSEASCIDLSLPIGKPISELKRVLGYWPRYASISPDQRANYLLWLSKGRSAELLDIGYAFLFFYGLEYRGLIEQKDISIIIQEVNSLLKKFTFSGSFNSYLSSFLAYIAAQHLLNISEDDFSKFFENPLDLSSNQVLVALAWYTNQRKAISWEIAYSLANTIPDTPKSVVTQKLSKQFKQLFETKFKLQYPNGLIIEPSLRNYKLEYRPASPSLLPYYQNYSKEKQIEVVEISNPLGKKSQFKTIFSIWNETIEELKPASRKVGKGEEELTAQAYQALPDSLKQEIDHPDKVRWDQVIANSNQEREFIIVPVSSLASLNQIEKRERLTPTQSKNLYSTARDVGYILIPDPRITGTSYRWDDSIAVYPLPDKRTFTSESYPTVAFILELGMSIALVDEKFSPEEQDHLDRFIFGSFELTSLDVECLKQYQQILIQNPPSLERLGTRLKEHLTESNKLVIAKYLRDMALADGEIDQSEYKALNKIFKTMGLRKDDIQTLFPSELTTTPSEQPIQISPPTSIRHGEAIGAAVTYEPLFSLNQDLLIVTLDKTREIQNILQGLINQEDEEILENPEVIDGKSIIEEPPLSVSVKIQEKSLDETLIGLHSKYLPFLKDILASNSHLKSDLQKFCRNYKFMMDATIEEINTWSDENLGDFLFENTEDDEISFNLDIKMKILEKIS
jgi:uncharacterized tellurite resistance protein B-like protein